MNEHRDRHTTERYRIAHISDLHFGAGFDSDLWNYIRQMLKIEAPDLIIISGDVVNTPWPFMLIQAQRELQALAKEVGAKLLVVPGNHDVGVVGILKIWPLSKFFRAIFYTKNPELLTAFPAFSEFKSKGRLSRIATRIGAYSKIGLWWILQKLPDPGRDSTFPIFHEDKRAFIVGLDSNYTSALATGYIRDGAIYEIQGEIAKMRHSRNPGRLFAPRIAVLHHHPLPIPYSSAKEGLTSYEPFLILRNAGTLLKELWHHDFDLILHGHRHYYNFARVGFGNRPGTEGQMGVLSAGSATVRFSEAGRNSANVIDIHPNGRISIKPYFFGGGQSARLFGGASDPEAIFVHTISGLKRRNFHRAIEFQEIECQEIQNTVNINAVGTAEITHRVQGFRVHGTYMTSKRSFAFAVDQGRIDPSGVMLSDVSTSKGFTLDVHEDEPKQKIHFDLSFGRDLISSGENVDFEVSHSTHNTFMLTSWEAEQLKKKSEEYIGTFISYPCRKLRMELVLPDQLDNPAPYCRCTMPKNYPQMKLDCHRQVIPADDEDCEVDSEMTEFEGANLRKIGEREWMLEVDYPMVGYQYEIRWRVSGSRDLVKSALIAGQTEDLRRTLLRYREARMSDADFVPSNKVKKLLAALLGDLCTLYESDNVEEKLSVSLMVYDSNEKNLAIVDGARNWDSPPRWDFKIPLGEGLAGAVFKKGEPILFVVRLLRTDPGAGVYLYFERMDRDKENAEDREERQPDYQALISVPLVHPEVKKRRAPRSPEVKKRRAPLSPMETIGVMSFGSDSPGSGLLRLLDLPEQEQERECRDIAWIMQSVFNAILDTILEREPGAARQSDPQAQN